MDAPRCRYQVPPPRLPRTGVARSVASVAPRVILISVSSARESGPVRRPSVRPSAIECGSRGEPRPYGASADGDERGENQERAEVPRLGLYHCETPRGSGHDTERQQIERGAKRERRPAVAVPVDNSDENTGEKPELARMKFGNGAKIDERTVSTVAIRLVLQRDRSMLRPANRQLL